MQPNKQELEQINKQLAELKKPVSRGLSRGVLVYLILVGCTAVLALILSLTNNYAS